MNMVLLWLPLPIALLGEEGQVCVFLERHNSRGVLRFELDRGVSLKPQNPYPSLRVILAKKSTHF